MSSDIKVQLVPESFFSSSSAKLGQIKSRSVNKSNTVRCLTSSPEKLLRDNICYVPDMDSSTCSQSTTPTPTGAYEYKSRFYYSQSSLDKCNQNEDGPRKKSSSGIQSSKLMKINKANTMPVNHHFINIDNHEYLNFIEMDENDNTVEATGWKTSCFELNSIIYSHSKKDLKEDEDATLLLPVLEEKASPVKTASEIKSELKEMTNTQDIRDFHEYTEECLNSLHQIQMNQLEDFEGKKVNIEPKYLKMIKSGEKKLAVFDLDETLVHRELEKFNDCDEVISVILPDSTEAKIGIYIRPHLIESLKKIAEKYILVLFTASKQIYADKVMQLIDPDNKLFIMKLYRDSCRTATLDGETIYIKDLNVFQNVPLDKTVIIDNSVLSFCNHLGNGIPILPFYNNKQDVELKDLVEYLDYLYNVDDLRVENKIIIGLQNYLKESPASSGCTSESDSESDLVMEGNVNFDSVYDIKETTFSGKDLNYNYNQRMSNYLTDLSEMSDTNTKDNSSVGSKPNYDNRHSELFRCLEEFQEKYKKLCNNMKPFVKC